MDGFLASGGLAVSILSIIFGIIIIAWPRLIAFFIGGYLIIVGIIGLLAVI